MLSVEMKRQMLRGLVSDKLRSMDYNVKCSRANLDYYNSPDYGRDGDLLKMNPELRFDLAELEYKKWQEVDKYVKGLFNG